MKRILEIALIVVATSFLIGCATSSGIVRTGPETLMVSKTQKGFRGASGPVLAAAMKEANQYCERQGKVLKVISTKQKDMMPFKSDASAEVHFKCLDPNDPELVNDQSTKENTDVYDEIARLNELRKDGALTDEEFEREKKKILEQTK